MVKDSAVVALEINLFHRVMIKSIIQVIFSVTTPLFTVYTCRSFVFKRCRMDGQLINAATLRATFSSSLYLFFKDGTVYPVLKE